MATIVESRLTLNSVQADGSIKVIEDHLDSVGEWHRISYTAPIGSDVNALMAQHALDLPAQLAEQEERFNIENLFVGNITVAQMKFDWSDPGDEVKLVCIVFMQASIENAIPIRPTVSGYTNSQITAFFTAQERNRIQGHAGELLAIEAQINQWNEDKEVLLGMEIPA